MEKITLILCICFTLNIYAQDTITTKVIVFDEDDMSKFSSEKEAYKKNAFKFSPLLILNGEIPIFYERALTNSLSVEAAIGITFKDYIGDLINDIDDNSDYNETMNYNPSFKFGIRYYTGGFALDGFYFALEFAKRKHSTTKEIITNNSSQGTNSSVIQIFNLEEEKSISEFKLIAGSQSHSYWDNFFVDYYAGVGIKNQNISEIDPDFSNNLSTPSIKKSQKSAPAIYLGLKIGFEF